MRFHNLREIDAVNIVHNIFSMSNNVLSVDEVQNIQYLPTSFDVFKYIFNFSGLDAMHCLLVGC